MQDVKQVGNNTNHNEVVAVGNSWVVCKSKSYAGRTYYFNTLTGEAAWNLSDAEVEKAKKRTKSLGEKSGEDIRECPEPTEPPMDDRNKPETRSQYIYNKKVINNRFTNDPYPVTAFVTPPCNHVMPSCSAGAPIGLNLATQSYNPDVWSIPPTHQIFIAPAVSPIVNQMQTPVNVQYRDPQNVSEHRCSRSHNPNFNKPRHPSPKYYNRGDNFTPRNNRFGQGNFQRQFQDKPSDLRDVLSSIRKRRQSQDGVRDNSDVIKDEIDNISQNNDSEYFSEPETPWVEEKKCEAKSNIKIDVSRLRDLAAPDADPDRWYIAVDRTILLENFNFLKMLIDCELDCQLLVPREELTALQELSTSRTETPRQVARAKRAYDYVLSQFTDNCAVQGEEDILTCCLNVAEGNYHVILLTNDSELLATNDTEIKMFNVNDLKAFLKSPATPIPPIKITIPNDHLDSSACETSVISPVNKSDNAKTVDVTSKVSAQPSDREKIDTGVQTDFATPAKGGKTSKIRLKRSTSNQTGKTESPTKKYGWRRGKRYLTSDASNQTQNNFSNCNSTSTSEDLEKTSDRDTGRGTSQVSVESGQHNYTCYEENVEGSDTSSLCMHRPVHEKIVIDETSTSGIISNTTASNHDFECVTNEPEAQFKPRLNYSTEKEEDGLRNNYMFEIPSPEIEEHIQTRRDEWVSQFVQIMEEVLSQVLRQNKPTSTHPTPPPWTMQEALQCFISSPHYYDDVIDAANKLSSTISKISDEQGKINIELRPQDFMDMYSYGVYLVDALQGQASNCEDLQTASDLLAKLYKDIQEPNLDSSHNDTFGEQVHETSDAPHSTGIEHDSTNDEVNDSRYNLRSRKSTSSDQQNTPATVKKQNNIRNIDTEARFFTSLNLHRRISDEIGEPSQKHERSESEFDKRTSDLKKTNTRYDDSNGLDDRLQFQRETLDLDQLDYSGNYDDNYGYTEDGYNDAVDDNADRELDADQRDHVKEQSEHVKEQSPAQSPDINGNTTVIGFIKDFINELRDVFIQVLQFCNNSDKQLREPGMTLAKRKTIHENAKKAYISIEDIIKNLNSILHRDIYQPENSIQTALKTAGIDGVDLNTKICSQYRDTIMKCLDQANILYEAVGIIVSATKK